MMLRLEATVNRGAAACASTSSSILNNNNRYKRIVTKTPQPMNRKENL